MCFTTILYIIFYIKIVYIIHIFAYIHYILNIPPPYDLVIPLLCIYPREIKAFVHTETQAWNVHACMLSHFSHVQLFATLWTIACQALLSMGFSRQEYWSGLPCLPPGDLPDPGIEPMSPTFSCISRQVLYHSRHLGNPGNVHSNFIHNSPNLGTTYMPIKGWVDKLTVVYSHSWLECKWEWTIYTKQWHGWISE